MSGFQSEASGIAASVYLALYTVFSIFMTYVVIKRGFKTLFTFIFIFCLFRFGGQLCGVVYAKVGPQYTNWLIAYLVLQAEGYFTLILTCFRFTCKAQEDAFGTSWVKTTGPKLLTTNKATWNWMRIYYLILVPANAFLIAGGSMTAGIDPTEYSSYTNKISVAKDLRTAGQIIFLLMTVISIGLNMYVFFVEGLRNRTTISVMIAGPFLIVRGIFGVLSIYIDEMNYFKLSNYIGGSVNKNLVIYEYVLAATMEFLAAAVLMTRYFAASPVKQEFYGESKLSESESETHSAVRPAQVM